MKHRLFSSILILAVLFGLFSGPQGTGVAQAADLICLVDDTAEGPALDGTTWASAYTDLQLAINDLNCTEIHVAAGTYQPDDGPDASATFQLRSGLTIQGGYPDGGGDTPDPISNVTILDGNNNHYHVVTGSGADSTALLDGFTIQGGRATNLSPHNSGAGVYINNGSPRLQRLVISGNTAGAQGAGLYTYGGNPILDSVTFSGNVAGPGSAGGNGGGMCIGSGSPSLTNVTFINNRAQDLSGIGGAGGGLLVRTASPSLDHVVFTTNIANGFGGGLSINNSSIVMTNVTFNGNQAGLGTRGGNGGGMYHGSSTSSTFTSITFSNNKASAGGGTGGNGGGLYLSGTSASLSDVTFDGNLAIANAGVGGNGAGLYLSGMDAGLTDVKFLNNVADVGSGAGGGIYISNANPSLNNVTVSGNESYNGAGIYITGGSPTLRNSVISGNTYHGGGGGIYLFDASPVLTNITISGSGGPYDSGMKGGGLLSEGDSNPELVGVTFTSNMAHEGGGMFSTSGSPRLTGVTFHSNSAVMGNGGGLFINSGYARLSDSQFDSNDAMNGAGIYLNGGRLDLQDSLVQNCVSSGGDGGGAFLTSGSDAYLWDTTFTHNSTNGTGGALYVAGNITMIGGTVSENISTSGTGGAGLELDGASSANFTDLMIDHNTTASGWGGGIRSDNSTATFANLRLTRNTAWQSGGMMLQNSTVTIVNATIAYNDAPHDGVAIYRNGGNLSISNAIVWAHRDGFSSINSATAIHSSLLEDGCPAGVACIDLVSGDPAFIDPANGDYRLPPLSPAVDAGDTSILPADQFDLDGDGNLSESIPVDLRGEPRLVLGRVDLGAYEAQVWNSNWTEATTLMLEPVQPGVSSASINRYVDLAGQSRWYKFSIKPDSKVIVTLTGLPVNYDLALYRDISQIFSELSSDQDLVQISAEFAPDTFSPDTFSPDTFSPDTFSPDTFSPDTFSPDTFSPDTFSPDTFSPDTFSPDTFSPDTFSPDTFSPDTFSPDTFSPDTFSPDTFSPDTFSPDTFSPDTFSSAQTRSLIAVSAHDGTQGEGIIVNTWTKSGDFYLRVRGRNGAFDAGNPFTLQVTQLSGTCGSVSPILPPSDTVLPAGNAQTLILTDLDKTEGTSPEKTLLQANLSTLAARTNGRMVNVGADARVHAAYVQAQAQPACVYAMNLQALAIKAIVDDFREGNPGLAYIVLVGNDHAIPFFRYADNALLASEIEYSPPVQDNSTSQASLKSGYTLSQDAYGAAGEVSYKAGSLPIPDLAVGRLVETASDINRMLNAYLGTPAGVIMPANALVTGYDFLEDAANAVRDELQASLGAAAVDTLIMDSELSPEDPSAWTANDLRLHLLGSRHDLVFLAGHFSANSALAADYKTHLMAEEVSASGTDFTNTLVYSAGCHSGYNIVNADGVPNVTEEPDWAQAFASKGATFIGGTGYQYGDTDFIEYSERLYLEFTRQLRYGSGPVSVGNALVQAKQAYLANTALMRGIHEKAMLEATLFGLPMLQFDLPGRIPAPVDHSVVTDTTLFPDDPGLTLSLEYTDLHVAPTFTEHNLVLDQISSSDETTTVNAFYLEGPDGIVVNPAEPVLPLMLVNVTSPQDGYVLRGAGWRGGTYTDLPDKLPLTGAATDNLRAPHPAFFSDFFYPVRPWNINYFDALDGSGGPTRLALMPAQYASTEPGSLTGILRRFNMLDFRLYYSSNIDSYQASSDNPDSNYPDMTNTPALSAPPDISHIASKVNPDGTVSFEVMVTGDPAAGIQEAWIVYTFDNGGLSGTWRPLELVQDRGDTRLWQGTLNLNGNPAAGLRFIVQAANGVGLVTMMTNQGDSYQPGVDPAAAPEGQLPVTLTLELPAASGFYGSQQAFTAIAAQGTAPIAGLPVKFNLGGQGRLAVTGNDGRASVNFFLVAQPGEYSLEAAFDGNTAYAAAAVSRAFTIEPGTTSLMLTPKLLVVLPGASAEFSATLTSEGLPLAGKSVALTVDAVGVKKFTSVAVSDYAGRVSWQVPGQSAGSYQVKAWFGLPVTAELDLSSRYYAGSYDTAALVNQFTFGGFFQPVANPPVANKVNAGSAVPVKFSLGGNFGLNIFAKGYPNLVKATCQAKYINPIEKKVNAVVSSLSYDPLTGQYTYTWKTDKKWAGTCGSLVMKFIDGTQKTALFQFTK